MSTRGQLIVASVLAGLLAVAFGGWYAQRLRHAAAHRIELPRFEEPGPGPRATALSAFGVAVGRVGLAEVGASIDGRGITCEDPSVRSMMQAWRAAKQLDIE